MNFQTQFLGFLFILICSLSSAQTVVPAQTAEESTSANALNNTISPEDSLKSVKRLQEQQALSDSINKEFNFPVFKEFIEVEVELAPAPNLIESIPKIETKTTNPILNPQISPADSLKSVRRRQKAQKALSDSINETFNFPEYDVTGDKIVPKSDNVNPEVDNMLNFAKRFLGVPYRWGGTTPSGFDCSGFIYYIMGNFGFTIVRTSFSMSEMGRTVKLSEAKKGDLMFFKGRSLSSSRVGHVGMVYDVRKDGVYIIHSSSSRGVVIENFSKSRYLIPRYLKLKRLDYGKK